MGPQWLKVWCRPSQEAAQQTPRPMRERKKRSVQCEQRYFNQPRFLKYHIGTKALHSMSSMA